MDVVVSHAGADGRIVDALAAGGVDGIVVAGTGNGTLHVRMVAALRAAESAGVAVVRATRCAGGGMVGEPSELLPSAGPLSPVQARTELMLALMSRDSRLRAPGQRQRPHEACSSCPAIAR